MVSAGPHMLPAPPPPPSPQAMNPPAQLVLDCNGPGGMPGLYWSGGNLLGLAGRDPSQPPACARYSVTLASPRGAPLTLAQAFQQGVQLVNGSGDVVFEEGAASSAL